MSNLVIDPVAPTAPTAKLPRKRPTTTRSAALNNSCKTLVRMMGTVYAMMPDSSGPLVRSRRFRFIAITRTIVRIWNVNHFKVIISVWPQITRGLREKVDQKMMRGFVEITKGTTWIIAPTNPIYQKWKGLSTHIRRWKEKSVFCTKKECVILYNFASWKYYFVVLYYNQKGWYRCTGKNLRLKERESQQTRQPIAIKAHRHISKSHLGKEEKWRNKKCFGKEHRKKSEGAVWICRKRG